MACSPERDSEEGGVYRTPASLRSELAIGLRSSPDLVDHAVHGAALLPGSYYADVAIGHARHLIATERFSLRNLNLRKPVILGTEDTRVGLKIIQSAPRQWTAEFSIPDEAGDVATLDIDGSVAPIGVTNYDEVFIASFKARAERQPDFYASLRALGNEYGPAFQRVQDIWRTADESLATFNVASSPDLSSLLDAMVQLLVPFAADRKKAAVLESIDAIDVISTAFADPLWGHATLRRDIHGDRIVGDVRVFDERGRPYLELSGVTFALLDGPQPLRIPGELKFIVASNFTAEPCEAALRFWGSKFGTPVSVEFAPYNQVFQQLLDPRSAFSGNRSGVNVVLLSLEDWAQHAPVKAPNATDARPRRVLPNGMHIAELNRYETDHLYNEIFIDRAYMRHGIELRDGATIIDIGANIGMFSLFVAQECENARVFAFEPGTQACEALAANCAAYADNVTVVNAGVSDSARTATFTFYEQSSVFSGFHPDEHEDRAAIEAAVQNALASAAGDEHDAMSADAAMFMAGRLRSTTQECALTTVSDIIRAHDIESIDLLKIDAEKSEIDILNGIGDADWPRIKQLVLEVHDRSGHAVDEVCARLSAKGFECTVEVERALARTGLTTLYAVRQGRATAPAQGESRIVRTVREFATALESFAATGGGPVVVCVCPASPQAMLSSGLRSQLVEAESLLVSKAATVPNVQVVSSSDLKRRYAVADGHDAHAREAGHVPYTSAGYAAIGTAVFRSALALTRAPSKLIVLDCDNTLWRGVCAEDGAGGVDVSGPYAALQTFMVSRMKEGMLLAVCSKNNKDDVLSVFDQRADMPLRREHIAAWRVNWENKSKNIEAIATELNVGLDSIIVVDDNPVECAEIRARCPGVTCIELPAEPSRIVHHLEHSWVLDAVTRSAEDAKRTHLYRDNALREEYRTEAPSLAAFINGLDLRIDIRPLRPEDVDRVAQLTLRTNQFNSTGTRRSSSEVRSFVARPEAECLVVRVTDRFGDYGLVGAVMFTKSKTRYALEQMLLSCRVLGRGVEHAVLAELGKRAIADGAGHVAIQFLATERNTPASDFFRSVGCEFSEHARSVCEINASEAASTVFRPGERVAPNAQGRPNVERRAPSNAVNIADTVNDIARNLSDVEQIVRAIESSEAPGQPEDDPGVTPGDPLEAQLLRIWQRVLSRSKVGVNDNFFEVGGSSLKAVQVVAAIRKETGHNVSIVTLFEAPSVARLAEHLRVAKEEPQASPAMLRGQRRKQIPRLRSR